MLVQLQRARARLSPYVDICEFSSQTADMGRLFLTILHENVEHLQEIIIDPEQPCPQKPKNSILVKFFQKA